MLSKWFMVSTLTLCSSLSGSVFTSASHAMDMEWDGFSGPPCVCSKVEQSQPYFYEAIKTNQFPGHQTPFYSLSTVLEQEYKFVPLQPTFDEERKLQKSKAAFARRDCLALTLKEMHWLAANGLCQAEIATLAGTSPSQISLLGIKAPPMKSKNVSHFTIMAMYRYQKTGLSYEKIAELLEIPATRVAYYLGNMPPEVKDELDNAISRSVAPHGDIKLLIQDSVYADVIAGLDEDSE